MSTAEITTRIHILDDNTANQIAAGEVIERPVSAVKELVENAIDAGARQVMVELEGAGKALIRVTDDGSGMSREDAIISLQRHATSKITTAADLFAIRTMGFRGEALPSIASVSRLTIVTKDGDAPHDAPGTQVVVDGGNITDVLDIGARTGTSIAVESLFFNVPARLKFLKTNATELSHITELMQRFTLANPGVAFRLHSDGNEIFSSRGTGSLLDACVEVYGRDQARNLVAMNLTRDEGLTVTGFVGNPQMLRPTRAGQHTFVNGRFVRDRSILRAIDDGYSSVQTIHGGKHPVIALMLDIDPSLVDVNVSPTKTEVRFTRDRDVFSIVYHAIAEALVERGGLVPNITNKVSGPGEIEPRQHGLMTVPSFPPTRPMSSDSRMFRDAVYDRAGLGEPTKRVPFIDAFGEAPSPVQTPGLAATLSGPADSTADVEEAVTASAGDAGLKSVLQGADAGSPPDSMDRQAGHDEATPWTRSLPPLRVLAQTRNMYIVAQTDDALVVIDQHIAHERVLYERLLRGRAESALAVQRLIIPLSIEFGKREALVLESRIGELAKAGFEIEPFGGETFLVRALPAVVAQRPRPDAVIRAIVDDLVEKTASRKLLVSAEEVLITASCKMAVKAGDPMSFEEMDALITQLAACENPYTCPHGRPIIIELPNGDLDRNLAAESISTRAPNTPPATR